MLNRRLSVFRDSFLLAAFGLVGAAKAAILAQVVSNAAATPATDSLAGLVTNFGTNGLLIFFLVASLRREIDQAKTYASDLKNVTSEQTKQNERLLTAVIDRLPGAGAHPDEVKERKK